MTQVRDDWWARRPAPGIALLDRERERGARRLTRLRATRAAVRWSEGFLVRRIGDAPQRPRTRLGRAMVVGADAHLRPAKTPVFDATATWTGDVSTSTPTAMRATLAPLRDILGKLPQLKAGQSSVLLDVSTVAEIDPGGVLLFMYLRERFTEKGVQAYLRGPEAQQHLILKHLNHYLRPRNERTPASEGDYLTRGIKLPGDMVTEVNEWLDTLRRYSTASEKDVALWEMQMSEVTTNGFQHGPTKSPRLVEEIWVAGKASGKRIQLAALDRGASIPAVIEPLAKARGLVFHDGGLISFACRDGVTSQCVPQNQGAGLPSLLRTLLGVPGGTLLILSRDGLYYARRKKGRMHHVMQDLRGGGYSGSVLGGTLVIISSTLERREK